MKGKVLLPVFLFFVLNSAIVLAQNKNNKKTIQPKADQPHVEIKIPVNNEAVKENSTGNKNLPQAIGDEINFKDEEGHSLITITDEGWIGSITIPSGHPPVITKNKLYNVEGTLYFNGNSLDSGNISKLNDLSDAISDGYSLFLGSGAGVNDDGTSNYNTAVGLNSLNSNTSGYDNTAVGFEALFYNTNGAGNTAGGEEALFGNTTGSGNTAHGYEALRNNTTGIWNTANGSSALHSNSIGNYNTATGEGALYENYSGNNNTATGESALSYNTANDNTANGHRTLFSNTTGEANTAIGNLALYSNTTGDLNTADGDSALYSNTTGMNNTATGYNALNSNTSGDLNTANGVIALFFNTTGYRNTANGYSALYQNTTGFYNTANGYQALDQNITGSHNTAVGSFAGPSFGNSNFNNTTALGFNTFVTASNQARIGNSSVTSIGGYADWTNISDIRYKKNIREDVAGLEFIMGLKPITYNLDVNAIAEKLGEDIRIDRNGNKVKMQPSAEVLASRLKKSNVRQSGFSAQAVEALAKKLGYDFGGVDKPQNKDGLYGLRYAEFVVPLVKAVQEQQKIIQNEKKTIETQQQELKGLKAELIKIEKEISSKQLADASN